MKKPVLKRVRFTFEALCRIDGNAENMDLASVLLECASGDMSGHERGVEVRLLTLRQARTACSEHGTDPAFFELPEFAVDKWVWWTDPDAGSSSGWYQIKTYTGEFYQLVNKAGGELEAPGNELSPMRKYQRKGKK